MKIRINRKKWLRGCLKDSSGNLKSFLFLKEEWVELFGNESEEKDE